MFDAFLSAGERWLAGARQLTSPAGVGPGWEHALDKPLTEGRAIETDVHVDFNGEADTLEELLFDPALSGHRSDAFNEALLDAERAVNAAVAVDCFDVPIGN